MHYNGCFPLCQNFQKFWLKHKWNPSVQVEIFWKKWSTSRGGPLWPVGLVPPKLAVPFSKILISSPTSIRSNQNFVWNINGTLRSVGNFVSTEQCRSIILWLVPLVSDLSVWQNEKHPLIQEIWDSYMGRYWQHRRREWMNVYEKEWLS